MKSKVLVTGVAGFIGSNLADRLLQEGYPVVGIDNLSYGLKEQIPRGVRFYKVDIRSKKIHPLFKGIDYVFHLAAKNALIDCQRDPVETFDINITGTANVFEATRLGSVKKIIYAQSSVLEEGEARLRGFYAISKMANQWTAEGYREAYGITSIGLRYFQVYGPRQDYRRTIPPVISKFIITLLKGKRPVVFEGDDNNIRDFVYIDDVNDFHLLCLRDERVDDKIFRIGSGRNYSVSEIYETIRSLIGVNPRPIYKPRIKGDPPVVTLADISDAKKLGWRPKTNLRTGLKAMIEYIKTEIKKGNIK